VAKSAGTEIEGAMAVSPRRAVQDVGSESRKVQTSLILSSVSEGSDWDEIITHDGDIELDKVIFSSARRAVQEEGIATISISSAQKGSLALNIVTASSSSTAALQCALREGEAGMDESIVDLNDGVRHRLPQPARVEGRTQSPG
jgi:hypothetical protein